MPGQPRPARRAAASAARPPAVSSVVPMAGLLSLVFGAAVMGVLHLLPSSAGIDPLRRTLSEYALGPGKWVFAASVFLVALSSAVLFGTLAMAGRVRRVGGTTVLGACWVLGLLTVMVFPKTDWSVGPSLAGTVHRYASVVAFVCLPVAVFLAAGAVFPGSPRLRALARLLAVTSLLWFGVILGAVLMMLVGGEPWWRAIPLGLVERGMAVTEVLAVLSLYPAVLRWGTTGREVDREVDDVGSHSADRLVPY